MNKRHIKKIITLAAPFFGFLYLLPLPVQAIAFLGPAVIAIAAYAILYLLQFVGAQFFIWASGLVAYFIDFNYRILENNDLIQTGWTIVRDVANLGFVIVIVVMAIATIMRFQEYSAKKILPKLIAAAILVNFSLVIAGVFVDFSTVLTKYFFDPIAGGDANDVTKLVETISGAFDPQTLFTEPAEPEPIDPEDEVGAFEGFAVGALLDIAKLAFTVLFTFIATFVLLAFALMLLIRYLHLSFLLVISPIVWLFWVIPALSGQFSKWWNTFLKWIFFAPAASFFFYLTLVSIRSLSQSSGIAPEKFFGAIGESLMVQGMKMVLLTGFMIGGLIISEKMGVAGASGAMGLMNKARGGVQKWAGRRGLQAATRPLRGEWGQKTTEWMMKEGKNPVTRLLRTATGIRQIGKGLNRAGAAGERLPEEEARYLAGMNARRIAAELPTMNRPRWVAAIEMLKKQEALGEIENVQQYIDKDSRADFANYGRSKSYEGFEKAVGMNVEMKEALAKGGEEGAKAFEKASDKFFGKFSREDFGRLQINDMFKGKQALGFDEGTTELLRQGVVRSTAMNNPGDLAKLMMNAKGEAFDNLVGNPKEGIEGTIKIVQEKIYNNPSANISKASLDIQDVLDRVLALRRVGALHTPEKEEESEKPKPPAPPTPAPPKPPSA